MEIIIKIHNIMKCITFILIFLFYSLSLARSYTTHLITMKICRVVMRICGKVSSGDGLEQSPEVEVEGHDNFLHFRNSLVALLSLFKEFLTCGYESPAHTTVVVKATVNYSSSHTIVLIYQQSQSVEGITKCKGLS